MIPWHYCTAIVFWLLPIQIPASWRSPIILAILVVVWPLFAADFLNSRVDWWRKHRTWRLIRQLVADTTTYAGMSRFLSARVALQEDFYIRMPAQRPPRRGLRRISLVFFRPVQRLMASVLAI